MAKIENGEVVGYVPDWLTVEEVYKAADAETPVQVCWAASFVADWDGQRRGGLARKGDGNQHWKELLYYLWMSHAANGLRYTPETKDEYRARLRAANDECLLMAAGKVSEAYCTMLAGVEGHTVRFGSGAVVELPSWFSMRRHARGWQLWRHDHDSVTLGVPLPLWRFRLALNQLHNRTCMGRHDLSELTPELAIRLNETVRRAVRGIMGESGGEKITPEVLHDERGQK